MAKTLNLEYKTEQKNNLPDVLQMVVKAVNQASQGKTKDLIEVCDRLEKKYMA